MITVKKDDSRSGKGNDQVIREFRNSTKRFGLVNKVRSRTKFTREPNRLQRRAAANRARKMEEHFQHMMKTGKLARMKKNKKQQRRRS
jgi:ribosomal protein S21